MFQVKICGLTSSSDALAAAQAGADALGLNFYSPSPRYVTLSQAQEIARTVRKALGERAPRMVGVFVNAQREEILQAVQSVALDAVQLHGDEKPEFIEELQARLRSLRSEKPMPIVRAFRCRDDAGLQPVVDYLKGSPPEMLSAVLLDAHAPGVFGGTGKVVDWHAVAAAREYLSDVKIILAGGLTPQNVAQAILTARPAGVDTASGVEDSPGVKDAEKMAAFVAEAKRGLALI